MRAVDVMLALPFMFLALCMMAVLGPSLRNVILVIGVTGWVPYARTIRANVLALRKREFVLSAEALGASPRRIMFKHIMPNVIDAAIVLGDTRNGRVNYFRSGADVPWNGCSAYHSNLGPNVVHWS